MDIRSRKQEQSEATRVALVEAAREMFSERGYARTSTEAIVQRARVTRGALYHHFRDKQDLFRAVYEDVERDVVRAVGAAAPGGSGDAWDSVRAGCHAFLDAFLDPRLQRIALGDAPAVLGWETWRKVDRQGLGLLRQGLETSMNAGLIERQPLEPLAHLLLGVLVEGVIFIARAEHVEEARGVVGATLDRILNGLRA